MKTKTITIEITSADDRELINNAFDRMSSYLQNQAALDMQEAVKEIVDNICLYAYDLSEQFMLRCDMKLEDHCFTVELYDKGLPFDMSRFRSEPLNGSHQHTKGLYRVYDLVDQFYISNRPEGGKCFTLVSESLLHCEVSFQDALTKTAILQEAPTVRLFQPQDAEGISKLIYRNYDYTYYKELYYIPSRIIEANQQQTIISIVAELNEEVVGHFALTPSRYSDIAEIGAAAVDPRYKKLGIMNQMFDLLVEQARTLFLSAIYGEGMMMHPYSQKANLRHGMAESAILLGEVPSTIEIEHSIKYAKRTGVVIAYLHFEKSERLLSLPLRYREIILKTYDNSDISYREKKPDTSPNKSPHEIRTLLNTAIIVFDSIVDENDLNHLLANTLSSHVDMIFADINLSKIGQIDELVRLLNQRLFVYSGVMFRMYGGDDYLRLQRKNTSEIEVENLICYSSFSNELMSFIKNDNQ